MVVMALIAVLLLMLHLCEYARHFRAELFWSLEGVYKAIPFLLHTRGLSVILLKHTWKFSKLGLK